MGYRFIRDDDSWVFYKHQRQGEVVLDFGDGAIAYFILELALATQGIDIDKFRTLLNTQ